MKLSTILFAATFSAAVYADAAPATVSTPSATTAAPSSTTAAPSAGAGTNSDPASVLDNLKQKAYGKEYHMPYVRVVQARVQSDKPEFIKGRFVSKYGKGDLQKGYTSAMDSVNTASVEGALLFVQAEGINQNSRAAIDRCRRKNNMNYVVLYEILFAQTNESIAQYSPKWNVPEYGPMVPMDSGACTPQSGSKLPVECLQYNGEKGQPKVGPAIGGGAKSDDVRAPYPDAYWFSFAHTCPTKVWGEKADADDACRASTRKGLCDIGQAPDGVDCTYTYDILGWVPIDDVVGITSLKDDDGNLYGNFTQWCGASKDHVEFAGDDKGNIKEGLPFWEDPKNETRNSERANVVVQTYLDMIDGKFTSTMVTAEDLSHFKDLPSPIALAEKNPPCYKTVPSCNSGNGCARKGFSQICFPCKTAEPECKADPKYTFPTLEKAKTELDEKDQTSGSKLGGAAGANGGITPSSVTPAPSTTSAATSVVQIAFASVAASLIAVLAL